MACVRRALLAFEVQIVQIRLTLHPSKLSVQYFQDAL